jgi:iron complex transport system substrate-binding protein
LPRARPEKTGLFILRNLQKQTFKIFFAPCAPWREIFFVKRRAILLILLSLGVFLSATCKNENPPPPIETKTREVTDDLGRRIKVPERLERVVSLAPNLTENIFAVGAGDRLVGVTSFCNYPPEAQKIQKVADTQTPNLEAIIALRPEAIFVSTASQLENFTRTLEQQNIAVFVTNPQDLEGVLRNLRQLGDLFGTGDRAEKLVAELENRVRKVEEKVKARPEVKVFVQIDRESLYTIGRDSFITDLIARAGGESVTREVATAYPKLSKETALALNPEAIILSESPNNLEPNDVFKNSAAVRKGRVFKIDADLLSRPAPRIVDALEQIARGLHPDNFR